MADLGAMVRTVAGDEVLRWRSVLGDEDRVILSPKAKNLGCLERPRDAAEMLRSSA
jgi:hypothetical protein